MEDGSVNDGVSCWYETCEKRQRGSERCTRSVGKDVLITYILIIPLTQNLTRYPENLAADKGDMVEEPKDLHFKDLKSI